jgi:hypothetical protein
VLSYGFHLFGRAKVDLRQLVIYRCQFKEVPAGTRFVEITRTFKSRDGSLDFEDSNIEAGVFLPGNTLHLQNIFLNETFGLTVRFLNKTGQFEFLEGDLAVGAHPLLEFQTLEGADLAPVSFIEASRIQ